VSTCADNELGRWRDKATDGGPVGGWLRAAMGNSFWAAAAQRADDGTHPPSASFRRGVLQSVMSGSSFNQRWAGPPSTGNTPGGVLLQGDDGSRAALGEGLLQVAMTAHGRAAMAAGGLW
jgi:hypothetical protein